LRAFGTNLARTSRINGWYQQRPSTIIDAVEHAEAQSYPAIHVLYEHQPTFVVSVGGLTTVFKCGLTAATRYAPVDKCWATTAPEQMPAETLNIWPNVGPRETRRTFRSPEAVHSAPRCLQRLPVIGSKARCESSPTGSWSLDAHRN